MMETLRTCFVITARQTEGKEGAEEIVDIESFSVCVAGKLVRSLSLVHFEHGCVCPSV